MTGPFQNTLAYDEVAVEVVIPAPTGTRAGGYLKLERRIGDFATAGVAVAIEHDGGQVGRAGIALTGVGGSTIEAREAADSLAGHRLDAATSPGPPSSPPKRPGRVRTTAAARRTRSTWCTPSSPGS